MAIGEWDEADVVSAAGLRDRSRPATGRRRALVGSRQRKWRLSGKAKLPAADLAEALYERSQVSGAWQPYPDNVVEELHPHLDRGVLPGPLCEFQQSQFAAVAADCELLSRASGL